MVFSAETNNNVDLRAATQVLNIPELLETILLFLDLQTLLLSQRVSRTFRDVATGSISIQKALFFKPLSTPNDAHIVPPKSSPEVRKCSKCYPPHSKLPKHIPNTIMANPLLDKYLEYENTRTTRGPCSSQLIMLDTNSDFAIINPNLDKLASSHESASWRRMLLLQPHVAPIYWVGAVVRAGLDIRNGVAKSLRHGLYMQEFVGVVSGDEDGSCASLGKGSSKRHGWQDPLQLYDGMRLVFGAYENEDVTDADEMETRKEIVSGICGWDVLGSRPGVAEKMFLDQSVDRDGGWCLDGVSE